MFRALTSGARLPIAEVVDEQARSAFQALSGLLWQERAELESVVAFLEHSGDDLATIGSLGHARHLLSLLELQRCVTTHELAQALQLTSEPSLSELIVHAPPGWAAVLRGHHAALSSLAAHVAEAEAAFVLGGPQESQRSLVEFLG